MAQISISPYSFCRRRLYAQRPQCPLPRVNRRSDCERPPRRSTQLSSWLVRTKRFGEQVVVVGRFSQRRSVVRAPFFFGRCRHRPPHPSDRRRPCCYLLGLKRIVDAGRVVGGPSRGVRPSVRRRCRLEEASRQSALSVLPQPINRGRRAETVTNAPLRSFFLRVGWFFRFPPRLGRGGRAVAAHRASRLLPHRSSFFVQPAARDAAAVPPPLGWRVGGGRMRR